MPVAPPLPRSWHPRFGHGVGALLLVLLVSLQATPAQPGSKDERPPTTIAGAMLGQQVLFNSRSRLDRPLPTEAFAPLANLRPTRQRFEGRLRLATERSRGGFRIVKELASPAATRSPGRDRLPTFDYEFVQDGNELLPMKRGPQAGEHAVWEWLLEPGKVWDLPEDGEYSRASLPFSLQQKNQNCTHNGVLTFLFKSDGTISQVAYQIGSETCAYLQFDAWGLLQAQYVPGTVADAAQRVDEHRRWRLGRLPQRPLPQLADDFPGTDPARFGAEIAAGDLTVRGVVVDGVHYVGGCMTRYGEFPYCDSLDVPSYSLAKSVFAGLGLMRLELLYPGAAEARIATYVPECASQPAWQEVTFLQALDMTTGAYDSGAYEVDEDADHLALLMQPLDHLHKIRYGCGYFKRKASPGTRWVYHTADTYVLGTAMQAFLRQKTGASADTYADLIVAPLWEPLGLSATSRITRRTYDVTAQPFTGWGLTFVRDDIARIADFLARGAEIHGRSVVDRDLLAAALQRVPAARGLAAGAPNYRYQHGFWARDVASLIGCPRPVWVPFLSGFGGISVVLFPNGISYYAVSDGGVYDWASAATAAHRIRTLCPESASVSTP